MSRSGELVPEIATILREIAGRIEQDAATVKDAERLRRLARHVSGEDKRFTLKLHSARGGQALGGEGVDRRFEMARQVKAYTEEHGCTNEEAYLNLDGNLNRGRHTFEDAWQEMGDLLDMENDQREFLLQAKRREARGGNAVKVTRRRRK